MSDAGGRRGATPRRCCSTARPASGRAASRRCGRPAAGSGSPSASMVFEMSAVAVLTTGARGLDGHRLGDAADRRATTSTLTVSLTFRTMPLRVAVLNPESVDLDDVACRSAGTRGGRRRPRSVGTVRLKPVSTLRAVTVAPGRRAAARVGDGADDRGGGDLGAGGRRQRERQECGEQHESRNVVFLITAHPSLVDRADRSAGAAILSRRETI